MKLLTVDREHGRLLLTVKATLPLRAAALAVEGAVQVREADGFAVYGFPAVASVVAELLDAFSPTVDPSAARVVADLQAEAAAVNAAAAAKLDDSALRFDVDLKTEPMEHQVAAVNFGATLLSAGTPGAALLMEQGTGKSLVAIALASWLHRQGAIRWALVIAPNSLKGTWGAEDGEIAKHSAIPGQSITVLREARRDRLETIAKAARSGGFPWVVDNFDHYALDPRWDEHFRNLVKLYKAAPPGLLILDESGAIKNARAKRTRTLHELAPLFKHRLILTGTPVTKAPLDVWAQFEVIRKGALGFGTYLAFERAFALHARRSARGRSFVEVVGYQNLPELERRVATYSYRARAADCLDLPDVVVKNLPVELAPAQARAVRQLASDQMAELDGGLLIDGSNVLSRYLREAQILGGFVGTQDADGRPGEVRAFDPNPKLQALEDHLDAVLEEPTAKAVVFFQFRAEIAAAAALCARRGWGPVEFHGGVPEAERDAGRQRFGTDPGSRVFLAQYQAGSRGLTLVSANHLVFYSLTFDLELYLQARKRVHRIGQTRTVTEAYLLARMPAGRTGRRPRTLDDLILSALREKKSLADIVTGDARNGFERARLADLAAKG